MSWFKKKKPTSLKTIDVESHIRELLFDCQFPEANEIAVILGSPRISDDVLEKEEEESDRRVQPLEYLFPLLHSYATLVTEGVVSLQKTDADVKEIPERFWKITRRLLTTVSFSLLIGALSQLNELNFIEVKDEHRTK